MGHYRSAQDLGDASQKQPTDTQPSAVESPWNANVNTPQIDVRESTHEAVSDGVCAPSEAAFFNSFDDLSDAVCSCPASGEAGCNLKCPLLRIAHDGQLWPAKEDYITRAAERSTPLHFVCGSSGTSLGMVGRRPAPVEMPQYMPLPTEPCDDEVEALLDQLRHFTPAQLQRVARRCFELSQRFAAPSKGEA